MKVDCTNCSNREGIAGCKKIYCEYEPITVEKRKETINHPSHYNQGIEAIDVIESWDLNFSLGNAIKYILRAPHKSNALEDLKKSAWYINREIERLEKLAKEE